MLHKLSLLMTGLVLMMGVAWFAIDQMMTPSVVAGTNAVDAG